MESDGDTGIERGDVRKGSANRNGCRRHVLMLSGFWADKKSGPEGRSDGEFKHRNSSPVGGVNFCLGNRS